MMSQQAIKSKSQSEAAVKASFMVAESIAKERNRNNLYTYLNILFHIFPEITKNFYFKDLQIFPSLFIFAWLPGLVINGNIILKCIYFIENNVVVGCSN